MEDKTDFFTPLTEEEKRPMHKSTFTAYVKPTFFKEKSMGDLGDDDVENSSPEKKNVLKAEEIRKQEILRKRQTDGYFQGQKVKKEKKKKHIFARKATYLPKADKLRISTMVVEEYRQYPTNYRDLGYGCIINFICYICNLYMQGFSRLMKYCGDICGKLEDKYTSANVGYGMMILSNTLYLVPTLFIKCNPHIDFSLAVMSRGILSIIFISQMAHVKRQELTDFPNSDIKLLVYRAFLTAISQLYFFFALGKLPLSINMVISNTGPIFVFIMSVFFFNGQMQTKDVIGIMIAICGVFCVVNPKLVESLLGFGKQTQVEDPSQEAKKEFHYAEGAERLLYICVFLVIYVGWAYGILIVKQLKKANTFAMNFFVSIAFFLVGAFTILFRPSTIFNLSFWDVMALIFLVGLFSFGSQYTFITSTFLNHNHGPLTMLGYLSVVKSYIIQVIFFNEVPSITEIAGSVLVLLGVAKIVIN
ncbi:integral membrane protein DUF6 containing protein (macronuclear) [Tetrahymena thermophila SB210]|uniref:Integral membrane protein DUF6 containing protein n=1 Tax=Tetrahymena thermophila (strain SB210) TaxID=312017 RepID=Q23A98_TETTS|nr:integral membrane protein DUF6 containing protein [Tetrahymena thermophila SB210]EAR93594.1 integral membrane protein DUF6 containing protein [Tetrahymena thermophila SB210]|eukprot:XP_001013839.1 integral membrane protein DUF6 containing protein [Tetrahymena thermophila SB210]